MTKISSRQLFFFLALIAPVGKIILLPTHLAYYSKNDLLFPAALQYLLQGALVFLVLLAMKREKSFYDMLKERAGKAFAKTVTTLIALFLFFAAVRPLMEQKLFVQSTFYDTLPSVFAFSSFFVFSAYICSKPLTSLGRVWDILAPLAAVGFLGIFVLSVGSADFKALSPALVTGVKGVFGGFFRSFSWFFDAMLLVPMLGKTQYKKGLAWKGTLCYLAGAAITLFFLAIFYGVFSDIAVRQQFAFAKVSKYFPGSDVLGRIDYLFIFSLALVMAFYAALPLKGGIELINDAFGRPEKKLLPCILSVALNLIILVISIVFDYHYLSIDRAVNHTLFYLFPLFMLPLALCPLFLIRSRREKQS